MKYKIIEGNILSIVDEENNQLYQQSKNLCRLLSINDTTIGVKKFKVDWYEIKNNNLYPLLF